jgi:hypothetical protein
LWTACEKRSFSRIVKVEVGAVSEGPDDAVVIAKRRVRMEVTMCLEFHAG